jgi:hypothetical protein
MTRVVIHPEKIIAFRKTSPPMLGETASRLNPVIVQTVKNTGVPAMIMANDKSEESQKSGAVTWAGR